MATGEWTEIDYRKMQPPGAKDPRLLRRCRRLQEQLIRSRLNADYIIKGRSKKPDPDLLPHARRRIPARGAVTSTTRTGSGRENRGHNIAMFRRHRRSASRSGSCRTPYAMPMTRSSDNSSYGWTAEWATITSRVLT